MAGIENRTIAEIDNANAAQETARTGAKRLQHEIRDAARVLIDNMKMTPEVETALERIILATYRTQEYLKILRDIERQK
jgi:hypothetical protein